MRIVFIGTGEIAVPTLQMLLQKREHEVVAIVTQPDKPVGRDQRLSETPVKAAAAMNLPIFQPPKINSADALETIAALAPEVVVVMAYGQILPQALLDLPRRACLNLHASLLPRWRGAAPIQAAIAAGDHETGITVMYMNAGLDTGDILLQHPTPIREGDSGASLHDRLAQIAPGACAEALSLIAAGKAPRIRQDESCATHAPKLEREDGAIDWKMDAEEIERKIRAFDPWPGAFTRVAAGDRPPQSLKIFRAHIVPENGRSGSVLHVDGDIIVSAADASLALDEVQLAGKRRMKAAEFARGLPGPLRVVD